MELPLVERTHNKPTYIHATYKYMHAMLEYYNMLEEKSTEEEAE